MNVILFVALLSPFAGALGWAFLSPPRRLGKHRGTPGQLLLQEAQRAEREAEHAQAIVVADFMEYGWTREQAEAQL